MNKYSNNKRFEVGDFICLGYKKADVKIIDYLKNKKDQIYEAIKIKTFHNEELINAPIFFAGFETQIEKIFEVDNIKFIQTPYLIINIEKALKNKDVKKVEKRELRAQSELLRYIETIKALQTTHENFALGLITLLEKNNSLLSVLANLHTYLYYNDLKVKAKIDGAKPKFKSIPEAFAYSWEMIISDQQSIKDNEGFLYRPSKDGEKIRELIIGFLLEGRKRDLDKSLRIGRSMSDLWLSRAKTHGKLSNCKGHICISLCDKEMKPININLKGKYYFNIVFWQKGKHVDIAKTDNPWGNKSFNLIVQKMIQQEIC